MMIDGLLQKWDITAKSCKFEKGPSWLPDGFTWCTPFQTKMIHGGCVMQVSQSINKFYRSIWFHLQIMLISFLLKNQQVFHVMLMQGMLIAVRKIAIQDNPPQLGRIRSPLVQLARIFRWDGNIEWGLTRPGKPTKSYWTWPFSSWISHEKWWFSIVM